MPIKLFGIKCIKLLSVCSGFCRFSGWYGFDIMANDMRQDCNTNTNIINLVTLIQSEC